MLIKRSRLLHILLVLLIFSFSSCDGHCKHFSPKVFDVSFLQPVSESELYYMVALGAGINSDKRNGKWFQEKIFFNVSGTEPVVEKRIDFVGSYNGSCEVANWHTFTKVFDQGDVIGEVISSFGKSNANFLLNFNTGKSLQVDFDLLSYGDESYIEPVSFSSQTGYRFWAFLLHEVRSQVFALRVIGNPVIIRDNHFKYFSLIKVNHKLRYVAFQNGEWKLGDFIFNPETGNYKFSQAVTSISINEPLNIMFFGNGYYFFVGNENLYYSKLNGEIEKIPLSNDNMEVCGVIPGEQGFWMLGCDGNKYGTIRLVKKVYFVSWKKSKFSILVPDGEGSLLYGMAFVFGNSLYLGYDQIPFDYKYEGVDFLSISENRNLARFEFDSTHNRLIVKQIVSDTLLKKVMDAFIGEVVKGKR